MQKYNFIPPLVHFKKGNENIAFDDLNLNVPTVSHQWQVPSVGHKRIAGCSSFGFGGANAHMILEAPPQESTNKSPATEVEGHTVLFMSGASKEALEVRKHQWTDVINKSEDGDNFRDVAATSFHRAQHHRQRLAIIAKSSTDAAAKLADVTSGKKVEGLAEGSASDASNLSRIAFIFTGMGSQWWAMGRGMYRDDVTFRETIQVCIECN